MTEVGRTAELLMDLVDHHAAMRGCCSATDPADCQHVRFAAEAKAQIQAEVERLYAVAVAARGLVNSDPAPPASARPYYAFLDATRAWAQGCPAESGEQRRIGGRRD